MVTLLVACDLLALGLAHELTEFGGGRGAGRTWKLRRSNLGLNETSMGTTPCSFRHCQLAARFDEPRTRRTYAVVLAAHRSERADLARLAKRRVALGRVGEVATEHARHEELKGRSAFPLGVSTYHDTAYSSTHSSASKSSVTRCQKRPSRGSLAESGGRAWTRSSRAPSSTASTQARPGKPVTSDSLRS